MNLDSVLFEPRVERRGEGRLGEAVCALDWSGCGRLLAAASYGGEVVVAGPGGEVTARFDAGAPVVAARWSPGGDGLAVGCEDGALWWWRPPAPPVPTSLGLAVEDLAWGRAGLALAAGDQVVLFEGPGRPGRHLPVPVGAAVAVAWAADRAGDGDRAEPSAGVVVGGLGGARLLRPGGPEETEEATWPAAAVISLAIDPGATTVAAGTLGGEVALLPLAGGPAGRLDVGRDAVSTVSWSAGGGHLAAVGDGKLRVWRRQGEGSGLGTPVDLVGHRDWVVDASFAPEGPLLASVGLDGTVALWDPAGTTDPLERVSVAGELGVLAWRPDGAAVAVGGPSGGYWVLGCQSLACE